MQLLLHASTTKVFAVGAISMQPRAPARDVSAKVLKSPVVLVVVLLLFTMWIIVRIIMLRCGRESISAAAAHQRRDFTLHRRDHLRYARVES